jgi:two-component system chemotaxis sensor kinase CheA
VDLAKYRTIFIEESVEHCAEMSSALIELEKNPGHIESIEMVFRMAHSIKGMAGSLGYDSITETAHRLEDRMQTIREAGRVAPGDELSVLFRGLSALEAMIEAVKETGEPPAADAELIEALASGRVEAGPLAQDTPLQASEGDAAGAPRAPDEQTPEPAAVSDGGAAAKKKSARPAVAHPPDEPVRSIPASRPPPTVRVNTQTLDRFLSTVGEVILNANQVRTSAEVQESAQTPALSEGLDRMDAVVGELQRRALELRTTRLLRIVEPLPRTAREIAERAGKKVNVEITGVELELDRSILDRIGDPLVHLLRNAVDHGIETPEMRRAAGKPEMGTIHIDARRHKDSIIIAVQDDGAGIDLDVVRARAVDAGILHPDLAADLPPNEIAALVFQPGVSTAQTVSEISGRGVGMDAVRATIESLGGAVEITSERGRGTTTSLVVPITAAVQRVLLLSIAGDVVAIPIAKVERILELSAEKIERSGSEAFALIDEELVPVFDLADRLAIRSGSTADVVNLVLTEMRGARVALIAERVAGQQQIYVKPVPELLANARALAGLTILGDGRPMFLLDLNQLS